MEGKEYIFLFQFLTFSELHDDSIFGKENGVAQRQLSLMPRVSFLAVAGLLLDQVMPMGSPWDCWSMNLNTLPLEC
jgi:hypothetical protein